MYRQSGLGKAGLIFRFADESVYVYWDTAGLPGSSNEDNYTAPYSTRKFDATARLPCSLQGQVTKGNDGCAVGINRGPETGQAVIAIMRSDGVERILQFDGDSVVSPGEGKIRVQRQLCYPGVQKSCGNKYYEPQGIAFDECQNLYISNERVRRSANILNIFTPVTRL